MIEKLTTKNDNDIYEFINRVKDNFQDMYITLEKQRFFLNDISICKKILKYHECFAIIEENLKGLLIIFRTKGFRPYIKILAEDRGSESRLIKYLIWNHGTQDLYIKLKKINPLVKYLTKINQKSGKPTFGFEFAGNRGQEILLYRKKSEKYEESELLKKKIMRDIITVQKPHGNKGKSRRT
jgi:hypothetical protein